MDLLLLFLLQFRSSRRGFCVRQRTEVVTAVASIGVRWIVSIIDGSMYIDKSGATLGVVALLVCVSVCVSVGVGVVYSPASRSDLSSSLVELVSPTCSGASCEVGNVDAALSRASHPDLRFCCKCV